MLILALVRTCSMGHFTDRRVSPTNQMAQNQDGAMAALPRVALRHHSRLLVLLVRVLLLQLRAHRLRRLAPWDQLPKQQIPMIQRDSRNSGGFATVHLMA